MTFLFTGVMALATSDSSKVRSYTLKPVESVRIIYEGLESDRKFKHGSYKLYFRGRPQVVGYYYQNKKQGRWEKFYSDGKLHTEGHYLNGQKHGHWKFLNPEGKLIAEIHFVNGIKSGQWTSFFPDQKPACIYNYNNDRLEGEFVLYHPEGNIAENTKINYVDTNLFVSRHRYYSSGRLYEEAYFRNNKPDSTYQRFHFNGLPWEVFHYRKGRLKAIEKVKSREGINLKQGTFEDGKGELRFYNTDGTIHSQVHYRNGLRSGKALYFKEKNLAVEGVYMRNQRIGTWKYFSEFGKLKAERNFYDASGPIHEKLFFSAGSEAEEGDMINGLRDGIWKRYNFYGEVEEETPYLMGYKHGTYKRYKGPLVMETGGYYFGEKVGEWKYFNNRRKISFRENFIKEVSFDSSLVEPNTIAPVLLQDHDFEYETPFEEAKFPGGGMKEIEFVFANAKFPEAIKVYDIKGEIILRITVNELGEISNIQVLRGLGYGCDKELVRIYKAMPAWEPQMVNFFPETSSFLRRIVVDPER